MDSTKKLDSEEPFDVLDGQNTREGANSWAHKGIREFAPGLNMLDFVAAKG